MNVALIFAGGVGRRMKNQGLPKQFLDLLGKPVLIRTLENFQNSPDIGEIYIVMLSDFLEYTQSLVDQYDITKVKRIVPGGTSGQESIYNGLKSIKEQHPSDNPIILIHDGVRPILESDLIQRNIESVEAYGSAISSIPAYETEVITKVDIVDSIIDRNIAWIARAPQSFYLEDILEAHQSAIKQNDSTLIDSCSMMKKYSNIPLHIVETIPENVKITTPIDYQITKALIADKEQV